MSIAQLTNLVFGGKMNTMRPKYFCLNLVIVVVLLLFIWGNSMMPASASNAESDYVLALIIPVIDAACRFLERHGVVVTQMFVVRKLAHLAEYAALGFFMLTLLWKPGLRGRPILSASLCAAAAAIDETIQLFADSRGPQLKDVLLDSIGACIGIVCALLIVLLVRGIRKRRST